MNKLKGYVFAAFLSLGGCAHVRVPLNIQVNQPNAPLHPDEQRARGIDPRVVNGGEAFNITLGPRGDKPVVTKSERQPPSYPVPVVPVPAEPDNNP